MAAATRVRSGCLRPGPEGLALSLDVVAWMPTVDALQKATDAQAAQAQLASLRAMLTAYDAHFE